MDKLQDGDRTNSIINDLGKKGIFNIFSEASKRTIKERDDIEFFELGETVRTTQCPSCSRYSKEGTVYCLCGKCLVPPSEQTEKIKKRIDQVIQENVVDQKQWQHDHWKAKDAAEGAKKRDYKSIEHRRLTDPAYQESQLSHGWVLEYCKYLDHLKTVNMDYIATWRERDRYQNMLVLRFQDGKEHGKMPIRDDFKLAARSLAMASHQGR